MYQKLILQIPSRKLIYVIHRLVEQTLYVTMVCVLAYLNIKEILTMVVDLSVS